MVNESANHYGHKSDSVSVCRLWRSDTL